MVNNILTTIGAVIANIIAWCVSIPLAGVALIFAWIFKVIQIRIFKTIGITIWLISLWILKWCAKVFDDATGSDKHSTRIRETTGQVEEALIANLF